jgi:hypothetical protein
MNLHGNLDAQRSLRCLAQCRLLQESEIETALALGSDASLAACLARAETIHLHIKVDDTDRLPAQKLREAGAALDHGRPGFMKYRLPGGVNAIFSHIDVSADDLRETGASRRARPFLDHIGIDMRDAGELSRRAFDELPAIAAQLGWAHAAQGGPGKAVSCCHVEVAQKHWLFPAGTAGASAIPLEFAFGPLKLNPDRSGCDLRPSDPRRAAADPAMACCGVKARPVAITVR